MKSALTGLLITVAMFAAPQVMTNQTVEAMVNGGVPLATIVAAIKGAARIQMTETKQDYDRLIAAGSSPAAATEIIKAVHYRQYVGIDKWPVQEASPAQTMATYAAAPSAQIPGVQPVSAMGNVPMPPAPQTAIPAPSVPSFSPVTAPVAATAAGDAADQSAAQTSFTPSPLRNNGGSGAVASRRAPKDAPRVFLQSASAGTNWSAVRNQSMEMSKDLERDCPGVKITINQRFSDYSVILNHIELGLVIRDNQIQVANKYGDLIANTKEGGSIAKNMRRACEMILQDWDRKP